MEWEEHENSSSNVPVNSSSSSSTNQSGNGSNGSKLSVFGPGYPDIIDWGLDPTFWSFRKMLIWSVHNQIETKIHPTDNLLCHFFYKRPIQKVEVQGMLVSIERSSKRNTIIIDDGTGCIRCIKYLSEVDSDQAIMAAENPENINYLPPVNPIDSLNVGDYVVVMGILEKMETNYSEYELMLKIILINPCDDPNMEIYNNLNALYLWKTVYSQPFPPPATPTPPPPP